MKTEVGQNLDIKISSKEIPVSVLPKRKFDETKKTGANALPDFSEFRLRWLPIVVYLVLHLSLIVGFWFFSWHAFWTGLISAYVCGYIGISVGYHRQVTHQSFQSNRAVLFFHLLLAALSMQLGPITWARTHKIHHSKSDTPEDPHAQIYGFWWGFCNWIFLSHKKIGQSPLKKLMKMETLRADPMMNFFEKHWFNIFLVSFIPLYFFGGWSWVIWAGCFRALYVSYFIWFLNVSGHGLGEHTFDTPDRSTNSFWVAIFSGGEGWHNNHHFMPGSARFGLNWKQVDIGFFWIRTLETLGLAWNVRTHKDLAPDPSGPAPSDPQISFIK